MVERDASSWRVLKTEARSTSSYVSDLNEFEDLEIKPRSGQCSNKSVFFFFFDTTLLVLFVSSDVFYPDNMKD